MIFQQISQEQLDNYLTTGSLIRTSGYVTLVSKQDAIKAFNEGKQIALLHEGSHYQVCKSTVFYDSKHTAWGVMHLH